LFAVTGETVRGRGPNADGEPVDPSQVVNIANIANSSDQPLALTIIAVNASTQKTAQVSLFLTPGGRQALGPDAGLRLDSGDQITLRSQGFHDFVATVP
jgi:D-lyxose ketol-isomerase